MQLASPAGLGSPMLRAAQEHRDLITRLYLDGRLGLAECRDLTASTEEVIHRIINRFG